MAMYSQSASSLFGLNCIWLAVDFSFYLCAAARCRLPVPLSTPSSPPSLSDCLARCFLLVFLSLSASRYKIKYLSLFFMANSLAETGNERRGAEVVVSVGVDVCSRMYVQLGHKLSAISA